MSTAHRKDLLNSTAHRKDLLNFLGVSWVGLHKRLSFGMLELFVF